MKITDLHVHLKGKLTIDDAVAKSKAENIEYGIAVNCGLGFPIHKDSQIDSVVAILRNYPQFYFAMQAEGREWMNIFSKESMNKFDYVFTDCMTFTDAKGRRNRIWMPEETWIDDEQVVNFTVGDNMLSIRPEVELSKPFGIASWHTSAALRKIRVVQSLSPLGETGKGVEKTERTSEMK